jgi:DoxX-like protein
MAAPTQVDNKAGGTAPASRTAARVGLALSAVVTLFLLVDSASKLLRLPSEVAGAGQLGFAVGTLPIMGALLLVSTVLYVVPRTALIGAVLITGYLGGALCATLRIGAPVFTVLLAPVYVAVPVWLGLYLRSPGLRRLVRHGR